MFFTLYRNRVSDDKLIPMWKQFKREHLTMEDIKEAFQNGGGDFSERAQETYRRICANSKSCSDLLDSMKDDPGVENTDWGVLVKKIRDRESKPLDNNMTLDVIAGGEITKVSMRDLEDNFKQENLGILVSQVCIPQMLIHEDTFGHLFNKESIEKNLMTMYGKILNEKRELLTMRQPNRKEEEIEKEAVKAAEVELKETREAQASQHRESLLAEDLVQKSIYRAAVARDLPIHIFRGVNTYQHIGKFLEAFGIHCSELKSFFNGERFSTRECENDIVGVALPPSGPVVSFVQVGQHLCLNMDQFVIQKEHFI